MMIMLAALSLFAGEAPAPSMPPRQPGETLRAYASRVIPKGERLDHVVQGDFGSSKGNIVIYFDRTGDDGAFLEGWALVPEAKGYRRYNLEGDYVRHAMVESILFANADADAQKELVVLTSAPSEMLIDGKRIDICYAYIFDRTGSGFDYLEQRSADLELGAETCNAGQVRRLLARK